MSLPTSAQEVRTRGECSPAVVDNSGTISINCYIDDVPLESVVRQGEADELIAALKSGISAETILQGFTLGNPRNLSGVSFFKNVDTDKLQSLLQALLARTNLNNRIFFKEDSYTSLFQLAASSGRRDAVVEMARSGVAVHAPQNLDGEKQDRFILPELFPILDLVRDGVVSIDDTEALNSLFANSVLLPDFGASEDRSASRRASKQFLDALGLRKRLEERVPSLAGRRPYDMKNIAPLCLLASKSDGFDWCARLQAVSKAYLNEDATAGLHDPASIELLGLLNIRDNQAVFLAYHTRHWGDVGLFFVPKSGSKYHLGTWNSFGTGGVRCWSEILDGFEDDCWRYYRLEEDIFEPGKLVGSRGYPVYRASDEKIEF